MNWAIARYTRSSGWAMTGSIDHGLCAPERANKFSNFCVRGGSSGHWSEDVIGSAEGESF